VRWLVALTMAGCWGYPTLAITARGNGFSFSRCGAPDQAPPLQSIRVTPVGGEGHATGPPVCRLALRADVGTAPVPRWTYGSPLPTLAPSSCSPLTPGGLYRIEIAGGGAGAAVFTAGPDGTIALRGEACR
jgi:hypothetical protein